MTTNTINDDDVADGYLAALHPIMSEWDSPEDEEAYRRLQLPDNAKASPVQRVIG